MFLLQEGFYKYIIQIFRSPKKELIIENKLEIIRQDIGLLNLVELGDKGQINYITTLRMWEYKNIRI